jgi:hypothetical protein
MTVSQTPDGTQPLSPTALAQAVAASRLPEARASLNLRLSLQGHEVLLTLRDNDEYRLLSRLEAFLAHLAPPEPPASPPLEQRVDWCATHGCAMAKHEHNGATWYSHKTPEGWCKGAKPKAADIPF